MALEIIHQGETSVFETTLKDESDVVIPQASITALTLTYKNKKTAGLYFAKIGDSGTDKIDCGSDASLRITGDITIEARLKMLDPLFPDPLTNYSIVSNENLDTNGYLFQIKSGDGKLMYRTNQAGVNQLSQTSLGLSLKDRWYHIAVTRSGTTAKFYIDGIEVSKELNASHINPVVSSSSFIIGLALDGLIDFVRVYNRKLEASEILDRYNLEKDIQIGLVSDWKFWGNFKDSKGSNHGTPSGTETFKNFGIINNRYNQDVRGGGAGTAQHTIGAIDGKLTWSMQAVDNILIDSNLPKGDIEEHIAEYIWTAASKTGKHVISIYVRKPLI